MKKILALKKMRQTFHTVLITLILLGAPGYLFYILVNQSAGKLTPTTSAPKVTERFDHLVLHQQSNIIPKILPELTHRCLPLQSMSKNTKNKKLKPVQRSISWIGVCEGLRSRELFLLSLVDKSKLLQVQLNQQTTAIQSHLKRQWDEHQRELKKRSTLHRALNHLERGKNIQISDASEQEFFYVALKGPEHYCSNQKAISLKTRQFQEQYLKAQSLLSYPLNRQLKRQLAQQQRGDVFTLKGTKTSLIAGLSFYQSNRWNGSTQAKATPIQIALYGLGMGINLYTKQELTAQTYCLSGPRGLKQKVRMATVRRAR